MKGNNWFGYSWTVFQIFSRNAVDGTPVQYGDIVGLRYPFDGYTAWIKSSGSYFYSKSCNYYRKTACAAVNTATGFQIFKQLWALNSLILNSFTVKQSSLCNWHLCAWKILERFLSLTFNLNMLCLSCGICCLRALSNFYRKASVVCWVLTLWEKPFWKLSSTRVSVAS